MEIYISYFAREMIFFALILFFLGSIFYSVILKDNDSSIKKQI